MVIREARLVQKLRKGLKQLLLGALVLKINDKSTSGIPDLVITHNDRTLWIETKATTKYGTKAGFKKHINYLQLVTCCQLERYGRCFYLIQYDKNAVVAIRPSKVRDALAKNDFDFFADIKFQASFVGTVDDVIVFICDLMKEPRR